MYNYHYRSQQFWCSSAFGAPRCWTLLRNWTSSIKFVWLSSPRNKSFKFVCNAPEKVDLVRNFAPGSAFLVISLITVTHRQIQNWKLNQRLWFFWEYFKFIEVHYFCLEFQLQAWIGRIELQIFTNAAPTKYFNTAPTNI